MNPVIVNNISKKYGKVQALKNISFEVSEGEIFGLIGPDGAGKSSLYRILTTLIIPDEGVASVTGCDVVSDFKTIRRQIGYMPGKFSLYQDLTIEENLNFFATVFQTTVDENYDLIKDIYQQIEPFKKRRAGQLSGGMKQKLALSCALIHRPKVLILDEPTTGVDAVSRKEFWDMLKNIREQGITILVSTPYMDEAMMCDRIGLILKGELMTISTPDEISSTYVDKLYALTPENMYLFLQWARGNKLVKSVHAFGQEVHISLNVGVSEDELTKEAGREKVMFSNLQEITPGIEDVFINLM